MFPAPGVLRAHLKTIIANRRAQGHVVDGLHEALAAVPDSFDALDAFAQSLATLPLRSDWPYVEPERLEEIWAECDPARPLQPMGSLTPGDAAARAEAAFLGSVCGCMLGKPVEINPTLDELRRALEARGEWPLNDYFSKDIVVRPDRKLHEDAWHTCRENLCYAAPDDDINYTVLGMLNLEQNGGGFTWGQLGRLWLRHQSMRQVWGPERNILLRLGLHHWGEFSHPGEPDFRSWVTTWNPHDELCGAVIRADAYGYACPGHPALAAELAWRDASFTHRKTGVYATLFAAAAIATAFVARNPLEIFSTALQFVPRRSRFFRIVSDSLEEVARAGDWLDGYARIHGKYREYSHCHVYQECGTLINTLRFATSVGDGICKQVSQGNDTDSFGATAGSILGAYFGPGHLEARWTAPFHDEIRTGLNFFYERSLSGIAQRMGRLASAAPRFNAGQPAPPP
jgi:ADP-ribosylglycohydrolase